MLAIGTQRILLTKISSKISQKNSFKQTQRRALQLLKIFSQPEGQQSVEQPQDKVENDPRIEEQKNIQSQTTQLLEKLLKAEDMQKEADNLSEQLDQHFFNQTAAFLELAKKEKDKSVIANLERCYKAAQRSRNKLLPPEIQLINQLLWAKKNSWRILLDNNAQVLSLNDGKFFNLIDKMIVDFDKQKIFLESNKLREIKKIASSMKDKKLQ
eukprot:TRINITY_DN14900_c0_g1_i1.p1 TRINITY_DN14900_c0_g1~~TRINITY_DN14900_c0_g1_i1.p1  ORF type:complete len:233 (-),score=36.48 TRINITY_DN14900_c0_g1_i1:191-826(-)